MPRKDAGIGPTNVRDLVDRPRHGRLSTSSFPVPTPWPAAWPTLAFFQFLLGPTNAPVPRHLLLGVLDPADELVAGQGRDVRPDIERHGIGDQCPSQVRRKLVDHPAGYASTARGYRMGVRRSSHRLVPCPTRIGPGLGRAAPPHQSQSGNNDIANSPFLPTLMLSSQSE